jgi:hypothetical protein
LLGAIKGMKIAIHQPNYLPWSGFFYKLLWADALVFLDNVQYTKNSYQNRTEIKTSQGRQWLTLPVLTKGKLRQLTQNVEINNTIDWRKKHWKTIQQNYGTGPNFNLIKERLKGIYEDSWVLMADLNEILIIAICDLLGIKIEFIKASELKPEGEGTELLFNICRALNVTTYISGPSGKKYLDIEKFSSANISIEFSKYECPRYKQLWGGFEPDLSIIDLISNCVDNFKEILETGKRT